MKKYQKILAILLSLIFLVQVASADLLATITPQGLSMAKPADAQAMNQLICDQNSGLCSQGELIGQVGGQLLQQVENTNQDLAKAVNAYKQINDYTSNGAIITQNINLDQNGQITAGTIEFGNKQQDLTQLLGNGITDKAISASNVIFTKQDGANILQFGNDGSVAINSLDQNGNSKGTTIYSNIKEGGKMQFDNEGQIINANITASEDASFTFENQKISVPSGMTISYNQGQIQLIGKNGEITNYDCNGIDSKINLGGDNLLINQNDIKGSSFNLDGFGVNGINGVNAEVQKLAKNLYDVKPGTEFSDNYLKIDNNYAGNDLTLGVNGGLPESHNSGSTLIYNQKDGSFLLNSVEGSNIKLTLQDGRSFDVSGANTIQLDPSKSVSEQISVNDPNSRIIESIAPGVSLTQTSSAALLSADASKFIQNQPTQSEDFLEGIKNLKETINTKYGVNIGGINQVTEKPGVTYSISKNSITNFKLEAFVSGTDLKSLSMGMQGGWKF